MLISLETSFLGELLQADADTNPVLDSEGDV